MKNILKFILVVFILTTVSCSTTRNTYRSAGIEKTNIITNDVVVDIKVDFKTIINVTSEKRKTIKQAKDEAYYKAITTNNIDVVVDPIFAVTSYGRRKHKAKLTGFGGKYTNPRSKIDVIKELHIIDTLDIKKFDVIFNGNSYLKANTNVLKSGVAKKKNTTVTKKVVKKVKKKTFGLKNGFGLMVSKKANLLGPSQVENNGFSIGISNYSKINNKLGFRAGLEYSFNEISNNLEMPLLLNYKIFKRFNIVVGPRVTYNFDPKDDSIYGDYVSSYRDATNTLNIGLDFGFRIDLSQKIALNWGTTIDVTGSDFHIGGVGMNYQF